ncbi:hypothetical protein GMOD_00004242 [Pyrenophora seminiperda CCB06]|uniref:Uncharacterized protein n=1 Tax=Pyrenophora seminiperda CCB06 TaxID=1302712 RepID=A0A3M7M0P1_9PLEO|nr:hypothetical protein GMOD_00004242 [Pyrenophora seminiperda CCB06]
MRSTIYACQIGMGSLPARSVQRLLIVEPFFMGLNVKVGSLEEYLADKCGSKCYNLACLMHPITSLTRYLLDYFIARHHNPVIILCNLVYMSPWVREVKFPLDRGALIQKIHLIKTLLDKNSKFIHRCLTSATRCEDVYIYFFSTIFLLKVAFDIESTT